MGICARDPTIVQNEAIQLLQSKDGLFHSLAKIAHSLRLAFPDSFTGSGETVDQFLKLSRDYFQFEEKCTTLNSELRKSGSTEVDFGFHMRSKFLAEVSLLDESDKGRSIPVVAENSSPSSLEATLKSDGPVEGNSGISRSLEFDLPVNDLENNIRADTNVTISSNTGVSPVPLDNTSFSKSDCRKIYPTLEYPNNPGSNSSSNQGVSSKDSENNYSDKEKHFASYDTPNVATSNSGHTSMDSKSRNCESSEDKNLVYNKEFSSPGETKGHLGSFESMTGTPGMPGVTGHSGDPWATGSLYFNLQFDDDESEEFPVLFRNCKLTEVVRNYIKNLVKEDQESPFKILLPQLGEEDTKRSRRVNKQLNDYVQYKD